MAPVASAPTARPIQTQASSTNNIRLGFGGDSIQPKTFKEIYIYENELDSNWSLANSDDVAYNVQSTSRWFEKLDVNLDLDSGPLSISFEPIADNGKLYFTVNQTADVIYSRDEIMGVSFWLHSGQEILDNNDVRVTVVGSNERTYWSPDDYSVFLDSEDTFSQTELYFLDFNRAIPQETWIKVEVWIDELLFDPDYEYVTGIYIKTDAGFRNKIYLDNLALIIKP